MGSGSAFCTAPLHEPRTRAVIAMTGARALPWLYWSMVPFGPMADQMGSFRYFRRAARRQQTYRFSDAALVAAAPGRRRSRR
jgi:hypothetical protein